MINIVKAIVLRGLGHEGVIYKPGDTLEMEDLLFAQCESQGVVELAAKAETTVEDKPPVEEKVTRRRPAAE